MLQEYILQAASGSILTASMPKFTLFLTGRNRPSRMRPYHATMTHSKCRLILPRSGTDARAVCTTAPVRSGSSHNSSSPRHSAQLLARCRLQPAARGVHPVNVCKRADNSRPFAAQPFAAAAATTTGPRETATISGRLLGNAFSAVARVCGLRPKEAGRQRRHIEPRAIRQLAAAARTPASSAKK